jgi:hypothetical protein
MLAIPIFEFDKALITASLVYAVMINRFALRPLAAACLQNSVRLVETVARPRPPQVIAECFAVEEFFEALLARCTGKTGPSREP